MIRVLLCLSLGLLAAAPQSSSPSSSARAVVRRTIDAVGGEGALTSISSLRIDTIGHEYFIDQSERPEGPFVVRYVQTSEARDVARGRSRLETQQRFVLEPDWRPADTATIVDR